MKYPWPEFWIHHPAADGAPVSLWRWLRWQYAEWLGKVVWRVVDHHRRVEHRALYGTEYDDDIPF